MNIEVIHVIIMKHIYTCILPILRCLSFARHSIHINVIYINIISISTLPQSSELYYYDVFLLQGLSPRHRIQNTEGHCPCSPILLID